MRHPPLLIIALMLSACSAGNSEPTADPVAADAQAFLPPDAVLIGKAYATQVSVPEGFARDSTDQLTGAFTLRHLRATDLNEQANSPSELCADTLSNAMQWSDDADARRPLRGPLLSVLDTARYFEMTRQINALPDWVAIERVFKCQYFDRAGASASALVGPAGKLNQTPIDASAVRELAEYLWQFSQYNNIGNAVITSAAGTASTGWRHTLTLASLTRYDDVCDQIDVFDWHFDAAPSGELTVSQEAILQIHSDNSQGIPSACVP
ncbi:MAG: hypothetical protein AB8G17_17725 [Gammaproteobacteria bacterium]